MKAFTVWQPWASFIILGAKPWEWRGASFLDRRSYRGGPEIGERIVLHAAARKVTTADIMDVRQQIASGESSLDAEKAIELLNRVATKGWPLSVGLGTVVMGEPITAYQWAVDHGRTGRDSQRIDHSKWAWPMLDIQPFTPPVACSGFQGFWAWPKELMFPTGWKE